MTRRDIQGERSVVTSLDQLIGRDSSDGDSQGMQQTKSKHDIESRMPQTDQHEEEINYLLEEREATLACLRVVKEAKKRLEEVEKAKET